jgi:hypothetical protein
MIKKLIYKTITNPIFISLLLLTIYVIIAAFLPMNNDEGIWSYIGRVWSQHGIPPYNGTVENKTPGIFELYALSYSLFSVNYIIIRLLGIVTLILNSLVIYFIGKKILNHIGGVFSMYIFGLTMSWNLLAGGFTSSTETFMILFSSLAFYFTLKGKDSGNWRYWLILAGISIGISIAFKQIALSSAFSLLVIFLFAYTNLSSQNKFHGLFLICLGIFVSTILSIIPLLLSGVSFYEYIDGAWLILLNSGSSASLPLRVNGFVTIWFFSRIVIFYPVLFLLFFQKELFKNNLFIGLLIWFAFDFVGVNSSGFYYGHQIKQLLPSFSIIIGILLSNQLDAIKSIKLSSIKYISIIIILFIIVLLPEKESLKNGYYKSNNLSMDYSKEIGVWLRNNSKNNDRIYITGSQGNAILYYSERESSSKYFNSIFITSDIERNKVLSDLKINHPVYILKPDINLEINPNLGRNIDDFIVRNYIFLEKKYNYDIFKEN